MGKEPKFIPMSINLNIEPNGEAAWPDLADGDFQSGTIEGIAALDNGTQSGRPTICFRIKNEDGSITLAQTTMRLFQMAAAAMEARYGRVE